MDTLAPNSQYAEALFPESSAANDLPPAPLTKALEPEELDDIYRGEPPSSPISPSPRPPSVSSTSSSSSGWSGLGLRRGALGAVLELAINRWARSSSGSSTSSTSSSSASSVHTRPPRRRRRRSSNATTHDAHLEAIRARRQAQEESRILPRELVLFLPAALMPQAPQAQPLREAPFLPKGEQGRVLRTTSLPLALAQLDAAVKRSGRLRRPKQPRTPSPGRALQFHFNDYMMPESTAARNDLPQSVKGKAREDVRMPRSQVRADAAQLPRQEAWWLDVASPTWSDMREIGKVLHLHPLTLEDILHQDPREKLELFPRLGYYFVVFRALESERTRSAAHPKAGDLPTHPTEKGMVRATNVYVVVFREGICSFHFEDIANHVERVRNKVLQLEETVNMSSDWIAHGILDSIVDDFFPLLNFIEQEIKDLDDVVLSIDGQTTEQAISRVNSAPMEFNSVSTNLKLEPSSVEVKEKTLTESSLSDKSTLRDCLGQSSPLAWLLPAVDRIMARTSIRNFKNWTARCSSRTPQSPAPPSPLMRMASTRRLVTSLTRLLGTKSEVVSQIRKRLTSGATMASHTGPFEQALASEVGIYLGDIQDHILTLQQSLAHYERMLSHSHPAYLSHLRVSLSQAKAGMDTALLTLSVVSVSAVAMQLLTGLFSINVGTIPRNNRVPGAPFNVFGIIVTGVTLVATSIVFLVRYWWLHAKRKYARRPKF